MSAHNRKTNFIFPKKKKKKKEEFSWWRRKINLAKNENIQKKKNRDSWSNYSIGRLVMWYENFLCIFFTSHKLFNVKKKLREYLVNTQTFWSHIYSGVMKFSFWKLCPLIFSTFTSWEIFVYFYNLHEYQYFFFAVYISYENYHRWLIKMHFILGLSIDVLSDSVNWLTGNLLRCLIAWTMTHF